jgi:hypothetical protein
MVISFENPFLHPHLVNIRTVGGIVVAKQHLAGVVQAHPGMLTGDLVVRQDDLASCLIATYHEPFGGDTKGATGEKAGSGD